MHTGTRYTHTYMASADAPPAAAASAPPVLSLPLLLPYLLHLLHLLHHATHNGTSMLVLKMRVRVCVSEYV